MVFAFYVLCKTHWIAMLLKGNIQMLPQYNKVPGLFIIMRHYTQHFSDKTCSEQWYHVKIYVTLQWYTF